MQSTTWRRDMTLTFLAGVGIAGLSLAMLQRARGSRAAPAVLRVREPLFSPGSPPEPESSYTAVRVHEFGGPEVMELQQLPALKPAAGQAVVDVRAVGVNPVDTYIRSGTYARKPPLPYTPGADGAGVVVRVGEGVEGLEPGDRVYLAGCLTGSYASQTLCSPEQILPLADHLSFAQGAAVNVPYRTAYRALFQRAKAKAGESVLIHGASGGVGIACVQFARAAGLIVFGTASSERGIDLILEQGAHFALNHRENDYLQQVVALGGVDIIVEMLSNVNLNADLTVLKAYGRVAVVGCRGNVEINPRLTMGKESSIMGVALGHSNEADSEEQHAAIQAGLSARTLCPIVGKTYQLAEAAVVHEQVLSQKGGAYGNLVMLTGDQEE